MGYTNETTHYGIPLPLGSDLTTPMDYNNAAEAIDTAVFEAVSNSSGAVDTAAEAVQTANAATTTAAGAVTEAQTAHAVADSATTAAATAQTTANSAAATAATAQTTADATATALAAVRTTTDGTITPASGATISNENLKIRNGVCQLRVSVTATTTVDSQTLFTVTPAPAAAIDVYEPQELTNNWITILTTGEAKLRYAGAVTTTNLNCVYVSE